MRSLVSEATICRLVHKMFRIYSLGHRSVSLLWYNASGFGVKNSINRCLWRKKAMKKAMTILITVIRLVRMGTINRKRLY